MFTEAAPVECVSEPTSAESRSTSPNCVLNVMVVAVLAKEHTVRGTVPPMAIVTLPIVAKSCNAA